jgi:hypothetical protein
LQAGWRASDEGDQKGSPKMGTTQPWQVFAWATVRYGHLRIYLSALNLNKTKPTIVWRITAKSWIQQWPKREGKKLAQKVAKLHPIGMLAWYLGDGEKSNDSVRFSIENNDVSVRKDMAPQMVQVAYQTSYGQLLDLLDCEKWTLLKQLEPIQRPVYATLLGRVFWITYKERRKRFLARTLFKLEEEELARNFVDKIRKHYNYGYMYKSPSDGIAVELPMKVILFLAEQYPEWRRALQELVQKYSIQRETPSLRRLLELAENPTPPHKEKFITKQAN